MKQKNLKLFIALAVVSALQLAPAYAAMDFVTGVSTISGLVITAIGALILMVAAFRGIEAVNEHRSIVPSLVGLFFGIGFTFGGAYFLTKMGVGAATGVVGL